MTLDVGRTDDFGNNLKHEPDANRPGRAPGRPRPVRGQGVAPGARDDGADRRTAGARPSKCGAGSGRTIWGRAGTSLGARVLDLPRARRALEPVRALGARTGRG